MEQKRNDENIKNNIDSKKQENKRRLKQEKEVAEGEKIQKKQKNQPENNELGFNNNVKNQVEVNNPIQVGQNSSTNMGHSGISSMRYLEEKSIFSKKYLTQVVEKCYECHDNQEKQLYLGTFYALKFKFSLELSAFFLEESSNFSLQLLNPATKVEAFYNIRSIIKVLGFLSKIGHLCAGLALLKIIKDLTIDENKTNLDINFIKGCIEYSTKLNDSTSLLFFCMTNTKVCKFINGCADFIYDIIKKYYHYNKSEGKFPSLDETLKKLKLSIAFNPDSLVVDKEFKIIFKPLELYLWNQGYELCGNTCLEDIRTISNVSHVSFEKFLLLTGILFKVTMGTTYFSKPGKDFEITQQLNIDSEQMKQYSQKYKSNEDIEGYIKALKLFMLKFKFHIDYTLIKGEGQQQQQQKENNKEMMMKEMMMKEMMEEVINEDNDPNNKKHDQNHNHNQNSNGFDDDNDGDGDGSSKNSGKNPEEIAKAIGAIFESVYTYAEEGYLADAKLHEKKKNGDDGCEKDIRVVIKEGSDVYNYEARLSFTMQEAVELSPYSEKKFCSFIDTLGKAGGAVFFNHYDIFDESVN